MPRAIPGATVLRLPQVKAKTGLARSTIYAQEDDGTFPPSFSLGPRAVGWLEDEVDAVILARVAGATTSEIKALVAELVAVRHRRDAR